MPETKTKGKSSATLEEEVQATLKRLEAKDPGLKQLLKKAYGYAVFPSVGKAALVVGGAYGRGLVYERGKMVGHAAIGQFTLGVQLGGDTFTEILVFESRESLDRFKKGRTAFAANASAVLVKAAAGGTADFEKGVAALAYTRGGMMLEAAIGGQKFKFKPAGEEEEGGQGSDNAGSKGKSAKGSQGEQSEEGDDQDQEGDEGEEDQQSGFLGRALGGVREAASKTSDLVKEHPVIATVVGTGLVASVAFYLVRSMRAGQDSEGEDEGQEEGDEEGQAEDQAESQDEGEEEEQQDDQEQDDAEDSQNGHDSPRMMRRGRSRV